MSFLLFGKSSACVNDAVVAAAGAGRGLAYPTLAPGPAQVCCTANVEQEGKETPAARPHMGLSTSRDLLGSWIEALGAGDRRECVVAWTNVLHQVMAGSAAVKQEPGLVWFVLQCAGAMLPHSECVTVLLDHPSCSLVVEAATTGLQADNLFVSEVAVQAVSALLCSPAMMVSGEMPFVTASGCVAHLILTRTWDARAVI